LIELFVAGTLVGLIMDVVWWKINYQKYEKGLEWHEHYHVGIEIAIVAAVINSYFLGGIAFAFILAEYLQEHKFAIKSGHFKESTIFGIVLFIILILVTYLFERVAVLFTN
jgi:hypothetical protein